MILVEGRGIYLCTPATGSRTTVDVLVNQCGGRSLSCDHHAPLCHMPRLEEHTEPVVTTIRDPYDYVLSRFWYAHKHEEVRAETPVEGYICMYAERNRKGQYADEFGSRMCMYRDYVDRFFLFEDGLQPIFDIFGFPDVTLPTIGKPTPMQKLQWGPRLTVHDLSDEAKELIEEHFAMELALYRQVKCERKAA